jgi:hypothetical protein
MPMFRKKPVVIEARQFDPFSPDAFTPLREWVGPDLVIEPISGAIHVHTLEGPMRVTPGDWIIRGVKGEFYPCKPDIFAATYEPSPSAAPARETPEDDPRAPSKYRKCVMVDCDDEAILGSECREEHANWHPASPPSSAGTETGGGR